MRRFLVGLLATIGGLALLVIVAGGVVVWRFMPQVAKRCRTASC